ncbi:hypothetical protein RUND412_008339 [Rhizina undulata]
MPRPTKERLPSPDPLTADDGPTVPNTPIPVKVRPPSKNRRVTALTTSVTRTPNRMTPNANNMLNPWRIKRTRGQRKLKPLYENDYGPVGRSRIRSGYTIWSRSGEGKEDYHGPETRCYTGRLKHECFGRENNYKDEDYEGSRKGTGFITSDAAARARGRRIDGSRERKKGHKEEADAKENASEKCQCEEEGDTGEVDAGHKGGQ